MNLDLESNNLLRALQNGDTDAFETIYHHMANKLLHYINNRIHDKGQSEEMVQEIFLSLWTRRAEITIEPSITSYLFASAKYQVLSYIRAAHVRDKYAEHFSLFVSTSHENTEELINLSDLKRVIENHIAQLPPKCQEVFRLSRYAGNSIREIAEKMSISTRTVENYITQALKYLREVLSHYPWTIILMISYIR